MNTVYKYCDKCGKPVEKDDTDNKYTFCLDCALELYQKIFCDNSDNSEHKKQGGVQPKSGSTHRAKYDGNG